jgi:hypothetical protein
VTWLRPPASRITVTPAVAYSARRAVPYSPSER